MRENILTPFPDKNCLMSKVPSPICNHPAPKLPAHPDFYSLLLANCRRQENGRLLLDLRTCTPLLRKSVIKACRLKQEREE